MSVVHCSSFEGFSAWAVSVTLGYVGRIVGAEKSSPAAASVPERLWLSQETMPVQMILFIRRTEFSI